MTASAPVLQEVPEGKFSAEFPSAPVREETKTSASGVDLLFISYQTERGGESVIVGYVDYPKGVQLSNVLDGAAAGAAANVKGTIQSRTDTTFMGHPATDVVIKTEDALVYGRLVLRGNRLYTLVGVDVGAPGRPAAYDRLVETFVLL